MTIKECYDKLNGDYNDAIRRLGSEKLIARFMVMYKDDDSMESLKAAVELGDIDKSFIAAHTLKGVAGNLSFKGLADAASNLTEQLRPKTDKADVGLYNTVAQQHILVINAIKEYEANPE